MTGARRPHTGRRRNEAAREAILAAAAGLLAHGEVGISVDTIAAAAGVGKQTIYRWWPSKGAVLLEAAVAQAEIQAPVPDTGSLGQDLDVFLVATFRTVAANKSLLRNAMAEALRDDAAAKVLKEFAVSRRAALAEILERAQQRGVAIEDRDLTLDQAFGVLWYRILFEHDELDEQAAERLAAALARSAAG
ncbi:TetR/AcrR family transcriptional regulator [Amycolatopsis acidicola]|uniref:TetR/AcrR family transcriptional regulator n=1 Tax=Amycolatopsis acidicola TaxID=2596893 RepID=A0A5N0URI4_9PSEU|nr:TetR/AcrR family transcriptional regulator [Amycolatopsis acidicola]KAA9153864.1 TetR/AcrR family transcriptional regulator [Amycolatopsis acidicola]